MGIDIVIKSDVEDKYLDNNMKNFLLRLTTQSYNSDNKIKQTLVSHGINTDDMNTTSTILNEKTGKTTTTTGRVTSAILEKALQ